MATFSNQATLSYGGTETNSNIVTGELLDVLTLTKTAVTPFYRRGGRITYFVSLVNTSASPFDALTITDNLGSYSVQSSIYTPLELAEDSVRLFVNGILQPMPDVSSGPPLVISDLSVPAGGNLLLLYDTIVNEFAPTEADSTITNTVRLTGCGVTTPLTVSETVSAEAAAVLTISKSLFPAAVTENGRLTYTFAIQNTGSIPASPADGLVITDTFEPILSDIAVTYNGQLWTLPDDYTYNTLTGVFTTAEGRISVPAAFYTRDPISGRFVMTPGVTVIQVTGTV